MGQLRTRRKAAKMLVAVVIMFAGCFFPVHCLNIVRWVDDVQEEVGDWYQAPPLRQGC